MVGLIVLNLVNLSIPSNTKSIKMQVLKMHSA